MNGRDQRGEIRPGQKLRRGFSMVDLLVSMAVMATLIAVLMPAITHVRAMAQRTECRSNIRQQGLALQMYAFDREGTLPSTVFSNEDLDFTEAPQDTVHLRVDGSSSKYVGISHGPSWQRWDGLGRLYRHEYIASPQIFYCPANVAGPHTYETYAKRFTDSDQPGPIVGNYQYRIVDSRTYLSRLDPHFTIVSNATRSPDEYSHRVGNNMLKADMSVSWYTDVGGLLLASITSSHATPSGRDEASAQAVQYAWKLMDTGGTYAEEHGHGGRSPSDDPSLSRDSAHQQYNE